MDHAYLVDSFEMEGRLLDSTLRHHPALRPLFTRDFARVDLEALKRSYIALLKLKADYVVHTVPALRAAGVALASGDADDRVWSELFLGYASGETDEQEDYGHHVWAWKDMAALGASKETIEAPPHPAATLYGRYFVDDAAKHPYAILGAKGVLEHFSIRVSDDIVRGLVESSIPNAKAAITFFDHHGVLDIDHVRQGDKNLEKLHAGDKQAQILEGAFYTSGIYRSLVHAVLPT